MSLHKFFKIEKRQSFQRPRLTLPSTVPSLSADELRVTNLYVEHSVNPKVDSHRVNYNRRLFRRGKGSNWPLCIGKWSYTGFQTLHKCWRNACQKHQLEAEIFRSTWPTITGDPLLPTCRIIPTAYASLVFASSRLHSKSSPINGVHISLNTWCPRTQLSASKVSI